MNPRYEVEAADVCVPGNVVPGVIGKSQDDVGAVEGIPVTVEDEQEHPDWIIKGLGGGDVLGGEGRRAGMVLIYYFLGGGLFFSSSRTFFCISSSQQPTSHAGLPSAPQSFSQALSKASISTHCI